jgi:hypothetical protein
MRGESADLSRPKYSEFELKEVFWIYRLLGGAGKIRHAERQAPCPKPSAPSPCYVLPALLISVLLVLSLELKKQPTTS